MITRLQAWFHTDAVTRPRAPRYPKVRRSQSTRYRQPREPKQAYGVRSPERTGRHALCNSRLRPYQHRFAIVLVSRFCLHLEATGAASRWPAPATLVTSASDGSRLALELEVLKPVDARVDLRQAIPSFSDLRTQAVPSGL